MGFAIKRADGTYRCWNANTQDDVLQPGEVWEAHTSSPSITVPPSPPSALIVALEAILVDATPNLLKLKQVLQAWRDGLK